MCPCSATGAVAGVGGQADSLQRATGVEPGVRRLLPGGQREIRLDRPGPAGQPTVAPACPRTGAAFRTPAGQYLPDANKKTITLIAPTARWTYPIRGLLEACGVINAGD